LPSWRAIWLIGWPVKSIRSTRASSRAKVTVWA